MEETRSASASPVPETDEREEVPAHRLAPRDQWAWLPTQDRGILMPHPWCCDCGEVKVVGAVRSMDLGGLVNLLARLGRRLRDHGHAMTEAQQRLIVMNLKSAGADDRFGLSRDAQLKILSEIAGKHLRMPTDVVESYVRSC